MEVVVAEHAGFCFGVTKAVETVYEQIDTGKTNIYTFGPIIHNETVVGDLEKKGVRVIEDVAELSGVSEGIVVIRSHGVTKQVHRALMDTGLEIVDATCPFVKRIHRIVEEESRKGKSIIVGGAVLFKRQQIATGNTGTLDKDVALLHIEHRTFLLVVLNVDVRHYLEESLWGETLILPTTSVDGQQQ